ncbi:MAG: FkbM family methyltransferase [Yoonia sp.]|uniref:FkbM family methyltransferase n=1 Tax=Yoonia sp. TaxID=2212373 RepID=UPI003EF93340
MNEGQGKTREIHDPASAQIIDRFLQPYDVGIPLIRLGDFGDGGYLVPDDLNGIAACYSPGVSQQATFELDLAKRGIPSFMADASVDQAPLDVPGAQFVKKFLGPRNKGAFMTLADWVTQTGPDTDQDLLLQMDIEGAEYETLAATPKDVLRRFRMIVIELHQLPSALTKPRFQKRALAAIDALKDDFTCVHLHTNNVSGAVDIEGERIPRVIEVTLLRKDRVQTRRPISGSDLPHALDRRHNPKRPDLDIPARWIAE